MICTRPQTNESRAVGEVSCQVSVGHEEIRYRPFFVFKLCILLLLTVWLPEMASQNSFVIFVLTFFLLSCPRFCANNKITN